MGVVTYCEVAQITCAGQRVTLLKSTAWSGRIGGTALLLSCRRACRGTLDRRSRVLIRQADAASKRRSYSSRQYRASMEIWLCRPAIESSVAGGLQAARV